MDTDMAKLIGAREKAKVKARAKAAAKARAKASTEKKMVVVEKEKKNRKDEENVSDLDSNDQEWVGEKEGEEEEEEKEDDEGGNGGAGGNEEEMAEGGEVCQIGGMDSEEKETEQGYHGDPFKLSFFQECEALAER